MTNREVAQKIVDRILEMIETEHSLPWVQPCHGLKSNRVRVQNGVKIVTVYPVAHNRQGAFYRGVNTYLPEGEYITFKQCQNEKGKIKKGAKSYPIVYWNFVKKEVVNADGEKEEKVIPLLKYYNVFNVRDCEGIGQKYFYEPYDVEIPTYISIETTPEEEKPIKEYWSGWTIVREYDTGLDDTAETVIQDYEHRAGNDFYIKRNAETDRAYYDVLNDYINVPCRKQYDSMGEYYSTLIHEMGHSTGHETRLKRFVGSAKYAAFGSESYSKEELVAEITAATMLNVLGLEEGNTFRNSTAYVKSWSTHIKSDPLMYVSAMNKALDAVNLILGVE